MSDIKRLHYFNHQFLVESDFTDEQQYHLAMRRRHNAGLHDYGVAEGLAVTRSGDREITVQRGMAIDRDGQELVLLESRTVSLSDTAAVPAGATVHVTIAYDEQESDPSTATGVTGYTRTMERPQVLASTTAPAGDGSVIRLARFTLTAGGNLPGNPGDVFADGRQLAGATLAPASVATDKLADGAVDENKLSADVRGRLVTNGDGHDHSGGDGAQIRHSSLSLDGGSNPHGTTAADVGALPSTGGTIVGNLSLHGGNVGLGTTPQPLSRLSLRSDDGPAGIAFATLATTSSDGSGNVTAVDVSAAGSGSGEKRGINCKLSGAGEKHAGYFSATSGAGTDFTQALHADASSEGTGVVMGLWSGLTGSGTGLKIGVTSEVSGGGDKYAGQFYASSAAGSPGFTNALRAGAGSDGTGPVMALWVNAEGSGAGLKEGIQCWASGAGEKRAAYFGADSRAGSTDYTSAVEVHAKNEGNGATKGLQVYARGSGSGTKEGVTSIVEGGGQKNAGQFGAYSGAGTAEWTNALYVRANSAGTGDVSGLRMEVSGDGKGLKEGISCVAHGSGPKRAAYFNTESPADSSDFADGVVVTASSQGTGNVLGFSVNALGSGAGQKEGIVCTVQGSGHKYGGQFRAYSDSGTADGSEGLRADARSEGTGNALGFLADASGSGPGQKLAVLARSYGAGEKLAGVFRADSGAGSTDTTLGLEVVAQSEGTGRVSGIRAIAAGEGSGFKEALSCSAGSGPGPKRAAYFSADNSVAGSTDMTEGVYVSATGHGAGNVSSLFVQASGSGTGAKAGVVCTVSGKGSKNAGEFVASSTADSNDYVRGLAVTATSPGNDTVYGMTVTAEGDGGGQKVGLRSRVTGGTSWKQAGSFYAESPSNQSDYTNGLLVQAMSAGTGLTQALAAYVGGSGTGTKYAIYAQASGGGTKYAGYYDGNVHVQGMLSKSSGTFLIDHPLDPENKTLRHSFVESPEDLCLYRGKVQLDAAGKGTVRMPSYFAALTREEDATVSLTAIGSKPFLAGYDWNRNFTAFTVHGEPGREVSYLVLADRDDPAIHQLRRPVEEKKGAGYFEKGQLLNPEAYGKAPKAAPDAVATARQTTARMDWEPPTFADFPAPQTPTTPPVFPLSPVATAPFPALEEEHKRMDEAWARSREEERQRMESFRQEEERRRRQLAEALAATSQQPGQSQQEGSGPIGTVDATTETPIAPPESAPPRRKKAIADRKKR